MARGRVRVQVVDSGQSGSSLENQRENVMGSQTESSSALDPVKSKFLIKFITLRRFFLSSGLDDLKEQCSVKVFASLANQKVVCPKQTLLLSY